MPTCRVHGIDLFYEEKGQGDAILFINGLSGDHLYFKSQLRAFSKRSRCVAFDNRDVGQSSYATQPYSIRDLAEDALGLMDSIGLPPAHVVGSSMGGMIALEMTLVRPERVRGLVLIGTLAKTDDWFWRTLQGFAHIRRHVADTATFFEKIIPWWVSHRYLDHPDRADWLRWMLQKSPHPQRLEGFERQIAAMRQHDVASQAARIRCPTYVMVGEHDTVIPVRYSQELIRLIPGARLVVLENVGHAALLEDSEQVNRRLAECLAVAHS
jgi:pimeloyl-ACP methyl ester carboxylesterase